MGSLSLLQGIFPTQGSNPGLPQCMWILYQLSHKRSKGDAVAAGKRTRASRVAGKISITEPPMHLRHTLRECSSMTMTPCINFILEFIPLPSEAEFDSLNSKNLPTLSNKTEMVTELVSVILLIAYSFFKN